MSTQCVMTAEQLLHARTEGPCELVRGELIMMTPAGFRHGRIACTVAGVVRSFVAAHNLGVVTGAETGFHIASDPDTVRAPDVAFVRRQRIPEREPVGFFPGSPDLAVEILSPKDTASDLLAKTQDWLDAGCLAVWVVDPQTLTVTVYRSRTEVQILMRQQVLEGGDVLPGFQVAVESLFA
ncbi:MAG: Uma2 family endonuclease [Thermoguttaceae bacterium]